MANSGNGLAKWIPIAAVIGAATGAAVGFLYAPREGKVVRRYIRERTSKVGREAKATAQRVRAYMPSTRHESEGEVPTDMASGEP